MIKSFKTILVQLAGLPKRDQRWLLRQLSSTQQQTFARWQGPVLLETAQRFRHLAIDKHVVHSPTLPAQPTLPAYCSALARQAPLFSAIILEQGAYDWQAVFLQQLDSEQLIQQALIEHVPAVKPQVKHMVFQHWQTLLSFETYLEDNYG